MRRQGASLASLDLNLILVLRELLRERNVTRAAERVGVTQPAVSAALSRLRRHFDDDLLVRVSRGYILSPLAVQLQRQVEEICAASERLFSTGARFDAATTRREFTLIMADYTVDILGSQLSQLFERCAPEASLRIRQVRESLALEMSDLIRRVDGIVAPERSQGLSPMHSVELFRDEWVCVTATDGSVPAGGALALADLADANWVVPFYRNQNSPLAPPVIRQLSGLGIRPHVAIGVESYLAVPQLIAGTSRVALMQRRLAELFAGQLGLRVWPCPGDPEPIVEVLWWHEDLDADPGHAWLRGALTELAAKL